MLQAAFVEQKTLNAPSIDLDYISVMMLTLVFLRKCSANNARQVGVTVSFSNKMPGPECWKATVAKEHSKTLLLLNGK